VALGHEGRRAEEEGRSLQPGKSVRPTNFVNLLTCYPNQDGLSPVKRVSVLVAVAAGILFVVLSTIMSINPDIFISGGVMHMVALGATVVLTSAASFGASVLASVVATAAPS